MCTVQVYVKMKNLENGSEYLWTKEKFLNRFDLMKELYRRYQMKNYDDYYEDESEDVKITKASSNTSIRLLENLFLSNRSCIYLLG